MPAPRGPLEREASKPPAQMRGKWSACPQTGVGQRVADLLRREGLEGVRFPQKKGGQQAPAAKTKAKSRVGAGHRRMKELELLLVSPPRPPPEGPPVAFVRGETLEPSTARPKVRISRKRPVVQSSFSSTEGVQRRSAWFLSLSSQRVRMKLTASTQEYTPQRLASSFMLRSPRQ